MNSRFPSASTQNNAGPGEQDLPFRMSRELVTQDGDSVDGPTPVEVGLQLLRRGPVVHLGAQRV